MSKKTNIDVIWDRLKTGKSVNTIDAILGKYGNRPILRLSDIIFKLRLESNTIETSPIRNKTNGASTASYNLVE